MRAEEKKSLFVGHQFSVTEDRQPTADNGFFASPAPGSLLPAPVQHANVTLWQERLATKGDPS